MKCRNQLHAVFISSTFISNTRLQLAKNQANTKQHLEVKPLLFENYSLSSSTLSSKIIRDILKDALKVSASI